MSRRRNGMRIDDLVFVGLNGRVSALDRSSGDIVWEWKSPKPKGGYITMIVEKPRIYVSVSGYLYALDALTGEQLWFNPLTGYGTGVASLATGSQTTSQAKIAQTIAAQQAAAAATAAATAGS